MGRLPKSNLAPEFLQLLRHIGSNIKNLREQRGLSQAELARRSKVSITTVNEIETRQFRDVRLTTLSALARTLDVPVINLLVGSDLKLSSSDQAHFAQASRALLRIMRKLE